MARKIKWGILGGASSIANEEIIPAILESSTSQLGGYASASARSPLPLDELGVPRFTDYQSLISDGELDALYIALPNSLHHKWIIEAVNHGVAVLCEKPLCMNVAEIQEISLVSQSREVLVAEAYMTPHHNREIEVRRLLKSARIGELKDYQATFAFTLSNPNNYRWIDHLGGGALRDVGIYLIDPIVHQLGLPSAIEVKSVAMKGDVDADIVAQLIYTQDVSATIHASFIAKENLTQRFTGTDGSLWIDNPFSPALEDVEIHIEEKASGELQTIKTTPGSLYGAMIENFNSALLNGTKFSRTLSESIQVQEVIDQILSIAKASI
ncbi:MULTISPECIES: Gfo/Idh/MocA family oxidoreductase [Acidithrix]|uniref:1,5-anhydro-D-fructose reductase n=1 Tax=Acidithrix ferrooxidans TaxID=1280514 RepID=A0A0D8HLG5_9ACTN|nr:MULTISPECIES: Gfo/Idh/MocA family oxidoreductase [Acidithrix]KJF17916.1 1,5-anhydro-D-fructose reductase [Acidithrix ferrooxidans]